MSLTSPAQLLPAGLLRAIENMPGQDSITFRAGDRAGFLAALLARLSEGDLKSLAELTTSSQSDFTLALLDAWAGVADVLTFYNERLANEAYLRTALERRSLQWLGRLVGYEPLPGLAASTHLAFTLDTGPGSPTRVIIPAGTQVQSVPLERVPQEGGEMPQPQPYETLADFITRPEWNVLQPRLMRRVAIGPNSRSAWFNLESSAGSIKTGDMLLFLSPPAGGGPFGEALGGLPGHKVPRGSQGNQGGSGAIAPGSARWAAARVTRSDAQPATGRLYLEWSDPLQAGARPIPNNAQVLFFRQRAAVYGHNAADWRSLPEEAKAAYLGTEVPSLSSIERIEWPHYVICAPLLHQPDRAWRIAYFPPTAESVAQAVLKAADAAFKQALTDLVVAFASALTQTVKAFTEGIQSIAKLAPSFDANTLTNLGGGAINGLLGSFTDILGTFVPNFSQIKWDQIFPKDLAGWLGLFVNPTDVPQRLMGVVSQAMRGGISPGDLDVTKFGSGLTGLMGVVLGPLGDLGKALGGMIAPIADAVKAITDIVGRAGALVGAFLETEVVKVAIKGLMENQIPIPRTAELVAFAALFTAKLVAAVVCGLSDPVTLIMAIVNTLGSNPENAFDDLLTALVNQTRDPNQQEDPGLTRNDLDVTSGLAAESVAVLGVSAAALGLGVGITAITAASVGAALIAVLNPFLLPVIGVTLAVTAAAAGGAAAAGAIVFIFTKDDMRSGALRAEKTIRDAVFLALQKDARRRRALPELSTDQVDLDSIYSAIGPDSWVLLTLPDGMAVLHKVSDVTEAGRNDFNLNSRVTRLTLEGASFKMGDEYPESEEEDRDETPQDESSELAESPFLRQVRNTTVFAQSQPLGQAEEPDPNPVRGSQVALNQAIPAADLAFGRPVILQGLLVSSQNQPAGAAVSVELLHLGQVSQGIPGQTDVLTFIDGLSGSYQRDSVSIFLNVAQATHGATQRETLGSGDASQPGQDFSLRGKPLTYTGALVSSLEVRVNGIAWREVPNLLQAQPGERAFSLHTADDGTVTVEFGDGKAGSRLPSGQENVTAIYRIGAGHKGEADAGRITLLTRYPPGVRSVTNPLPASGSRDPRSLLETRAVVPARALALDRAVSLEDYALYALLHSAASKTLATWSWDPLGRFILLTVAGQNGQALSLQDLQAIRDELRKHSDPHIRLTVNNYQRIEFSIAGTLMKTPEARAADVYAAVLQALQDRYSFERRSFGQAVTLVEVLALIQSVTGVLGVDLDALYRPGQPAAPNPRLPAYLPQSGQDGAGAAMPAELLVLGPVQLSVPGA